VAAPAAAADETPMISWAQAATWWAQVTWLELWGDVTGLLCVWLVARQNIWNWPLGIVNNVLFLVLFWRSKLYADAVLQIVFAILGAYGWTMWLRVSGSGLGLGPPVRQTTTTEWAGIALFLVVAQSAGYWWLAYRTDSPVPFWDTAVLTLSLAALYGQARKLLESWYLWIAVDVISVPLYVVRGLLPTALLYFLFGCLCVKGLLNWREALRQQASPATA
jgi:nicotinamide mononucleotide transporter